MIEKLLPLINEVSKINNICLKTTPEKEEILRNSSKFFSNSLVLFDNESDDTKWSEFTESLVFNITKELNMNIGRLSTEVNKVKEGYSYISIRNSFYFNTYYGNSSYINSAIPTSSNDLLKYFLTSDYIIDVKFYKYNQFNHTATNISTATETVLDEEIESFNFYNRIYKFLNEYSKAISNSFKKFIIIHCFELLGDIEYYKSTFGQYLQNNRNIQHHCLCLNDSLDNQSKVFNELFLEISPISHEIPLNQLSKQYCLNDQYQLPPLPTILQNRAQELFEDNNVMDISIPTQVIPKQNYEVEVHQQADKLKPYLKRNRYYLGYANTTNPNRLVFGNIISHRLLFHSKDKDIQSYISHLFKITVNILPEGCLSVEFIEKFIDENRILFNLALKPIKPPPSNTFLISFNLYYKGELVHKLITNPIVFSATTTTIINNNNNKTNNMNNRPITPLPIQINNNNNSNSKTVNNNNNNNYQFHPYKKPNEVNNLNRSNDAVNDNDNNNSRNNNIVEISQLQILINHKDFSSAKTLIENGNSGDINFKNKLGQNCFHTGCYVGAPILFLNYLVERGCNYLVRDSLGFTGLNLAMELGHIDLSRDLIREYPELIKVQNNKGLYPLHYAVLANKIELVKIFSEAQMQVYTKLKESDDEEMLIHKDSIFEFSTDNITDEYLLRKVNSKYDFINLPDNEGMTPLHWSAALGFNESFNILIIFCGINLKDNSDESPIFKAMTSRKSQIIEIISNHKYFNPEIKNKKGEIAKNLFTCNIESKSTNKIISGKNDSTLSPKSS